MKQNNKNKGKKIYDVTFDITYFTRVKAKNENDAIEQAFEMSLNETDGQSEAHNIKVNEIKN